MIIVLEVTLYIQRSQRLQNGGINGEDNMIDMGKWNDDGVK